MKLKARKLRKTKSKIRPPTRILPLNEEGGCHGKNAKLPPTNFFIFYYRLKRVKMPLRGQPTMRKRSLQRWDSNKARLSPQKI